MAENNEIKAKLNLVIKNGTESNKVVTEFTGDSARRIIAAITSELVGSPVTVPTKETITSFEVE